MFHYLEIMFIIIILLIENDVFTKLHLLYEINESLQTLILIKEILFFFSSFESQTILK